MIQVTNDSGTFIHSDGAWVCVHSLNRNFRKNVAVPTGLAGPLFAAAIAAGHSFGQAEKAEKAQKTVKKSASAREVFFSFS
jgi:hypothetical protein